jgi:protein TonB
MLIVISDTGYVCSAQVIQGLGKQIDAEAVKSIQKWRFHPAIKDGHPVPVAANIQLNYRLDQNGNIIANSPENPQATESAKH